MNSIYILALITAVGARIVTQEAIFAELQAWARKQQSHSLFAIRKLTYPLQCQFCFSVWVAIAVVTYMRWAWPVDQIIGSILAVVGVANAFLVAYELATVYVVRIRQGNHHRALNLEWKRTEFQDWKEWRDDHRRKLAMRRSMEERPFIERVQNGVYGYPWNEGPSSAQNEGLEQ